MCTLTIAKTGKNSFILSSNRDEDPERYSELPNFHVVSDRSKAFFPKDLVAGGTWIGTSQHDFTLCLLNGANKKHEKNPGGYATSRGLLLRDFFGRHDILDAIAETNYVGMEPFTLVLVIHRGDVLIYEYVWDGTYFTEKKIERFLSIWSSSTLYSENQKKIRRSYFFEEYGSFPFTDEKLHDFHHVKKIHNNEGIFLDRPKVKTIAFTQIVCQEGKVSFSYKGYVNHRIEKQFMCLL